MSKMQNVVCAEHPGQERLVPREESVSCQQRLMEVSRMGVLRRRKGSEGEEWAGASLRGWGERKGLG